MGKTGAALEYARGLPVVKVFGKGGASLQAVTGAVNASRDIHLKIEWGYVPGNALHLLALKCGSAALALSGVLSYLRGEMAFSVMLMFVFYSFSIFANLEPISDSAHTLGVIDDAMDQLDALRSDRFIDAAAKTFPFALRSCIQKCRLRLRFAAGAEKTSRLRFPKRRLPQSSVRPARQDDDLQPDCPLLRPAVGAITLGGHDLKEFTCDSLLSNISMVFQNVYLFHDTIRANILFGKPGATEAEMIDAAKKRAATILSWRCRTGLTPWSAEGSGTLSGGEKQRISIARAELRPSKPKLFDLQAYVGQLQKQAASGIFSAAGRICRPSFTAASTDRRRIWTSISAAWMKKIAELEAAEAAEREAQQTPGRSS